MMVSSKARSELCARAMLTALYLNFHHGVHSVVSTAPSGHPSLEQAVYFYEGKARQKEFLVSNGETMIILPTSFGILLGPCSTACSPFELVLQHVRHSSYKVCLRNDHRLLYNELLSSVITAAFALPHHEFPKSHHTIHQLAQPTVSEKISGGFIV